MPRLSDIQGQEPALQVLRRAISSDKLAHAYLFGGPEGVGKLTTARAIAAALSCTEDPGQGCGACNSCRKFEEGIHPDLFCIAPEGAGIKIDQVRALEQHLGYPPHEGRYRVVIIDGAELLNQHAANALLKSVEEPRARTLFALVSSAPHRVAPTLVSRCQRVRFQPLPQDALLRILETRASEVDPGQRRAAAALAGGSAGRALRLMQSDQMQAIQSTVRALVRASQTDSAVDVFQAAEAAGKDRLELSNTLDYLRIWLRDLLLLSEGLGEGRLIDGEAALKVAGSTRPLGRVALLQQLRALEETQAALRGNVQPALALETLILSLRQVSAP